MPWRTSTLSGDYGWLEHAKLLLGTRCIAGWVGSYSPLFGTTSLVGESAPLDILPPYASVGLMAYRAADTVLPIGSIVIWDGAIDADGFPIVDGVSNRNWRHCDGSAHGIPDLRGRFGKGAVSGLNGEVGE